MIDLGVATNGTEEETAGGLTHKGGLVGNGRETGSDKRGMDIVGETDNGNIVGHTQAHLLNGGVGGKGDDVVESENGIGTVGTLQELAHGTAGLVEIDATAGDKGAVDGQMGVAQGLEIAVLAAHNHVEVVGTTDEGDTAAAGLEQVGSGLVGGLVAIGGDGREEVGQAGATEEDQGDTDGGEFLEMAVVAGVLCQTGDDAVDMETKEIVDGTHLVGGVLMAVGADDAIALGVGLALNAVEDGTEIVGDDIGHNDANDLGRLLTEAARKGVGTVVELLGQRLDALLHLGAYLGGAAQGAADGGYADAELCGEVFEGGAVFGHFEN